MIPTPQVEPVVVKLNVKIARLLKSAVLPQQEKVRKALACLKRVYADEQGILVATDGKRLVIVYGQTALSHGLWKPLAGESFVRDYELEKTTLEARGKRGLFVEWADYATVPGEYQEHSISLGDGVSTIAEIQGACVQFHAFIDWVRFASTVKALVDLPWHEIKVKCPIANTRPTTVELWGPETMIVQAIFMPYNGDGL